MADKASQFSERPRPMNAVAEAAALMRALAEPAVVGEGVKAAIRRASSKAGIDTGLGKRLWYSESRRIDSETMDRLRLAAGDAQVLGEALAVRRTFLKRLAACEAALGLQSTNEACDGRDAHGKSDRGTLGALDRSLAEACRLWGLA